MYSKVIQFYIYTYPFFFRFFSIYVITEYWTEFPVLFSRSLLIIYFIHVPCLVTQSRLALCDPIDYSLPGFSVYGYSPGKNTGMSFHFLLQGIFLTQGLKAWLLGSPALQADSLSLCHLGHLLQGIFPTRGSTRSPALQAESLPAEPPGKPKNTGVGSLSLLPEKGFPTQESNWGILHCR